jgi:hypothetical protein
MHSDTPVAGRQVNVVVPPGMIVPGGGLSITVCVSGVFNGTVADAVGGLDPVPVPVPLIVRLVFVPGAHPNVPTETVVVCTCNPGVTEGCPMRYAHEPGFKVRLTGSL